MSKSKAKQLFEQAENDLNLARKELYRPSDDVVSYSACVFSRRALYRYLEGLANLYAAEKHDPFIHGSTIEVLIEFCSKYNQQIKEIDFSDLNCKCNELFGDDDESIIHCSSVDKVNYCKSLAERVREISLKYSTA